MSIVLPQIDDDVTSTVLNLYVTRKCSFLTLICFIPRVEALLHWLEDCSKASVSKAYLQEQLQPGTSRGGSSRLMYDTLSSPSPEHVQCVAAILWYSMELSVTYQLHKLVSVNFIRYVMSSLHYFCVHHVCLEPSSYSVYFLSSL